MNNRSRRVNCILLALVLVVTLTRPAFAALVWETRTVESLGDLGLHPSLAIDGNGRPVISYYDESNADLKLVHCGDATCRTGNITTTVESVGRVGQYTSLVLDVVGRPVIAYYDETNLDLKLVHCGDANCSSGNNIRVVDQSIELILGVSTSLRLDNGGRPVISYYDSASTGVGLARCSDPNCDSGTVLQTIDATGRDSSLALDAAGNPVISYEDVGNADLKLAHCSNPTCNGGTIFQVVDQTLNVGFFSSLKLDSNGRPIIAYFDTSNSDLKLAHCGDVNCSSGNSIQVVDALGIVGALSSLAVDSRGFPVIAYHDTTNSDLKVVQCGNANCTANNIIQVVDQIGLVGQYASLLLDSNDRPVISYFDTTNRDLKLARLVDDGTGTLPPIILGSTTAGLIGGVSFGDEDLLHVDPQTNLWSKLFDGSDVGLKDNDVDAFALGSDTKLLISLEVSATLPGVGLVMPGDILKFNDTSLGERTRGSFEWFLDGSDIGLDTTSEDIDAMELLPDGRLLISTRGSYNVPGVLTGQNVIGEDEDLLVLNNPTYGEVTTGSWAIYFDGTDVGLTDRTEDVHGVGLNSQNEIFLSTDGIFSVPSANGPINGDGSDIFVCTPGSLGTRTTCAYRLYFDGDVYGFGDESIDSFELAPDIVSAQSVDAGDPSVDPVDEDDRGEEAAEEEGMQHFFLPWVARR